MTEFSIGGESFVYPSEGPWTENRKPPSLRIGLRRFCWAWRDVKDPRDYSDAIAKIQSTRLSGMYTIHQKAFRVDHAQSATNGKHEKVCFGIEVWVTSRRATSECIRAIIEIIENVSIPDLFKQLAGVKNGLNLLSNVDTGFEEGAVQEFIDVRTPSVLGAIDQGVLRNRLVRCSRSSGTAFLTATFTRRRLTFGPERAGAIMSASKYLEQCNDAAATDKIFNSEAYSWIPWIPLLMAVMLPLTWISPLKWPDLAVWMFAYAVLMAAAVLPWLRGEVLGRYVFYRGRTVAAGFFFVVALFATAYAIAALFPGDPLGRPAPTQLGYAYLVSTGMTFTVGLLGGALSGSALIIAHVQMIVFLSAVGTAAATIFQIERNTRSRRDF